METEEVSQLVEELDQRVERLRVLYDQYFMGIEKIPPEVLKKDVERRVWILRREKIRNTGIRFRFQQIIQRLSTFGAYWQRICREIENGTYKRDVMRAKKRFGAMRPAPAVAQSAVEQSAVEQPAVEQPAQSIDVDLFDISVDEAEEPARLEAEFPPLFPDSTKPKVAPPIGPLGPRPGPPRPPPGKPQAPHDAPPAAEATAAPRARTDAVAPRAAAPTQAEAPAPIAARMSVPSPAKRPSEAADRPDARHPFARASAPRMPVAPVRNDDDLDAMLDLALGSKPPAGPAAKPTAAAPAVAPIAAAPRPTPSSAQAPSPFADARAPTAARPSAASQESTPPAHRTPQRISGPQRPPPEQAPADPDRNIYAQYVEARRKNGESTAGLTFESLSRNLRETRERLKTKSGGRSIDFDVIMKDGKTILKPKVR